MDANAYPLVVLPPEQGALVPVAAAVVGLDDPQPQPDFRAVLDWLWRRFCKLAFLSFLLWAYCRHLRQQLVGLRQQANYWKSQHGRAVEREAQWKETVKLREAELRELKRRVYGRKSETAATTPSINPNRPNDKPPRNRGQQRGSKGHGRRKHDHLPAADEICDLPDEQKACGQCGCPFEEIPGTANGEILEIDVRAYRRRYHRKRYRCTCGCAGQPGVLAAPPPDKLIPKSGLGISLWVFLLQHKFQFFQPLHRVLAELRGHGLAPPAGTITDGLQKLVPLFEPLYEQLCEHNRAAEHWHCDETRWLVFVKRPDKAGFVWMLWVFVAKESIVFVLDPFRSHDVPEGHFGDDAEGIANVDRYSAYKAMAQVKAGKIILSFCWAHVRRDFLAVLTGWSELTDWAWSWLEQIGLLYHRNQERLAVLEDAAKFGAADQLVRDQVEHMRQRCATELAEPDLRLPQRKTLTSLQEHWTGLTVFVDHPEVPMDNNKAERCQRGPVVARKNFYGSGALWSGRLAAMLFSLFQTMPLWGLDIGRWLTAYLSACAKAGGKPPPEPQRYLPWNMSPQEREGLGPPKPKPSPATLSTSLPHPAPTP
jgi:transposase